MRTDHLMALVAAQIAQPSIADLFPVEPSKAPPTLEERIAAEVRSRWTVLTHHDPKSGPPWIAISPCEGWGDKPTDEIAEIMARHCRLYEECDLIGYGATEAEAVIDLARQRGWLTRSIGFFA